DRARRAANRLSVRTLFDFGYLIKQLERSLESRKRGLQGAGCLADGLQRRVKIRYVSQNHQQLAERKYAPTHVEHTNEQDCRRADGSRQINAKTEDAFGLCQSRSRFDALIGISNKTLLFVVLAAKRLDDAKAGQHFLHH